ncbi:MAG: alpha/beta fold hydrolase [Bacilli bacterium]|nr:alpha/beta fold hydrolase [Bacilli bacterium]
MCLISYVLKKNIAKSMPSRHDGSPYLKCKSVEDFPGLKATPFSFYSKKLKLNGFRYFYDVPTFKGVVVFFHGAGNGHLAYITEINSFAKEGYLVYAYDNSFCGASEGEGFWNFSSSLVDQKYFFEFLDKDEPALNLKRYASGHSWGGFTALASLSDPKYKIEKVVEFSGFTSVLELFLLYQPNLKGISWILKIMQHRYFGKLGNLDCLKILKNTDKKVLMVHGDKDATVPYEKVFLRAQSALEDRKNINFLVVKDRHHQPYFSISAQTYYLDLINQGVPLGKVNPLPEIDYDKLTEEDPLVMKTVFDFLSN